MNHLHKRRLYYIGLLAMGLGLSASLILYALKQNINVFLTPSQLQTTHLYPTDHLRLGGMVKMHSVVRNTHNLDMQFIITDYKHDMPVRYNGVLPDLFREGKGVIVEGALNPQGVFIAYLVLAKHDENYMPKNVYKALRGKTA